MPITEEQRVICNHDWAIKHGVSDDLELHPLDELYADDIKNTDFNPPPWATWTAVTTDSQFIYCVDEDHACAVQRIWRAHHGLDPITGQVPLSDHIVKLQDKENPEFFEIIEIRHDMDGFYGCTVEDVYFEDRAQVSSGFDGRPHFETMDLAREAILAGEFQRK